ncbi:hypothetical protein ES288_A13G039700v1 [Gossypium darwinii]|uniref:Phytocyanin domain-containing protein n=1 Tax=Gossypium darwinii TaxID=34276 RepID=A0A5D2DW12_GOSDA|nr:hypothetical protein ES288_A13G039700v1 [Gossypium darwinii]
MGSTFAHQGLVLVLVAASMVGVSLANKEWRSLGSHPHPHHPHNHTNGHKRIIVGGSQNWHFGVNYTDWSRKNGPFYINDTLVFKYDPRSNTTFPHSVYLLPHLKSFQLPQLRLKKS